jgi:hypothetical protein
LTFPQRSHELMSRGLQMPGAMCGRWGVCGATASVGAALSILETTGPLTSDDSWGSHMVYTSRALEALSRIGGPRCCKRDAYISLETAVDYIRERFGVRLEKDDIRCEFHPQNAQCLGERCPFFPNTEFTGFILPGICAVAQFHIVHGLHKLRKERGPEVDQE